MATFYGREPLRVEDGIPVFSGPSTYRENYDEIAATHLEALRNTGHNPFMSEGYWAQIEAQTAELIRRHSSPGAKILDVGVGLGRLLGSLPGLERHGMDISLDYLKKAREEGIEVCLSMVEDMPYKDDCFDLVVTTDVLEHVFDLNLAVSNILRVLKPGGAIVVRVPYREELSAYLSPDIPFEFVHLRSFDEASLTLLFEKIFGCEVLEVAKTGYLSSPARLALDTDESRALLEVLPRLESVAPDLHWDILRRLQIPHEINIVVRKLPETADYKPTGDRLNAPPQSKAGLKRTLARDKRLLEVIEQNAYLAVRARDNEAERRYREQKQRVEELEALKRELEERCDHLERELLDYRTAWEEQERNPAIRLKRFVERFR